MVKFFFDQVLRIVIYRGIFIWPCSVLSPTSTVTGTTIKCAALAFILAFFMAILNAIYQAINDPNYVITNNVTNGIKTP
jgi:hypothetical protein